MRWMWLVGLALCAITGCSEDNAVASAGGADAETGSDTGLAADAPLDGAADGDLAEPALDVPGVTPECTTHDDCDDDVECTGDLCTIDGVCSHELADEICLIDGVCVATGEVNPANECEVCDSAVVLDAWAARPDASCDDGDPCTGSDTCNKSTCQGVPLETCCGNGEIEGDETCDGDCPATCPDGDACTADTIVGTPEACDVICIHTPIIACEAGDGCCPSGCSSANDSDCEGVSLCGNGTLDPGELCDGDCPESCDDGDGCTLQALSGSAENCDAQCVTTDTIAGCVHGDGCCLPDLCGPATDDDCPSLCGNGVLNPGELCDGQCPKSCVTNDACTPLTVTGSNTTCDAECVPAETITACLDDDGCCAPGCDASNDNDCDPSQTCQVNIEIHCIDSPLYAANAYIWVDEEPGVMNWSYPPNDVPLLNFCTNNNGDTGKLLEASSGCVTATFETGNCVMPEEVSCEASLCYDCP